jgi:hypothetical protein
VQQDLLDFWAEAATRRQARLKLVLRLQQAKMHRLDYPQPTLMGLWI